MVYVVDLHNSTACCTALLGTVYDSQIPEVDAQPLQQHDLFTVLLHFLTTFSPSPGPDRGTAQ